MWPEPGNLHSDRERLERPRYVILIAYPERLMREVSTAMDDGYEPLGRPFATVNNRGEAGHYEPELCQALVLNSTESKQSQKSQDSS